MTINDFDRRAVRTQRKSDYPVSLRPGVDFRDQHTEPEPTDPVTWALSGVVLFAVVALGWVVLAWL